MSPSDTRLPSQPSVDPDVVFDMGLAEMRWRLEDNDRRAEIADHVLIKLVAEANKAADRRRAERQQAAEGPEVGVLELVKSTNLSPERKRQLIEQELKRIREQERELVEALAEGDFGDG